MNDSCCICGLILATQDSNFPDWCKTIRALCLVEYEPLLSGPGYVDNGVMPYSIEIPHRGSQRFCFGRTQTDMLDASDFCYPFHAACWTLLEEIDVDKLLGDHIGALYNIFESLHHDKRARSLRWGHNFYIEDILDFHATEEDQGEDVLTANKANHTILLDPLQFNSSKDIVPVFSLLKAGLNLLGYMNAWFQRTISAAVRGFRSTGTLTHVETGIESIPFEILQSILYSLEFSDVQHLLQASPVVYRRARNLPPSFWESRFWVHGEAAFARSLRPSSCSLKEWFFTIKMELRNGPNRMNLRNRKRIWKLGVDIVTLVRAITAPDRTLYGDTFTPQADQVWGLAASCVAAKHDSNGCRQLKQVYVPFDRELSRYRLRAITAYFVVISSRRLISGLTFTFGDGELVNAGYIVGKHEKLAEGAPGSNIISLISTRLGFEAIRLTKTPEAFASMKTSGGYHLAVNQWQLEGIEGVYLGLDAMRIVSICIKAPEQDGLGAIAWTPPFPLSAPCIDSSDAIALRKLQMASFAPASTINAQLKKGQLIAVKVYSALGCYAGIAGLQFVYDTGCYSNWGFIDNTAALTFFLHPAERIVKVIVYKENSVVYHLQMTTNLNRKSDLFPQLIEQSSRAFQSVEYTALGNGYITGFCGCFMESSQQLRCFGVTATNTLTSSKSAWTPSINNYTPISTQMPIGSIQNHGQHMSRVSLQKNYKSIEASISLTTSKFRRRGQVTGLLFRLDHDTSHPDLLGQWTGPGKTHVLHDNEYIIDLEVMTIAPRVKQPSRSGLSQVKGITVLTNRRRISWGPECVQTRQSSEKRGIATAVSWEFNAIFDRVDCIYTEI